MMTLQQLTILLAVRDHESLTRAAAALGYGVPTVKHHLRSLEGALAAQLVESTRSGTWLTPLGEALAGEAVEIVDRVRRAERTVAGLRDAGLVTLRVGTFASVGAKLLPGIIIELQRRSQVRVEVIEGEPTDVARMLREGEIDLGILYDSSFDEAVVDPDLEITPLFTEPFMVMIATEGPFAGAGPIDIAELGDVAWVASRSDDEASDRVLRRVYRSIGPPVRELMRTDDLRMIHGLVEAGLGFALATPTTIDSDFHVELAPTVQDLGFRRVSFATRTGTLPQATRHLGELLSNAVAQLPDSMVLDPHSG